MFLKNFGKSTKNDDTVAKNHLKIWQAHVIFIILLQIESMIYNMQKYINRRAEGIVGQYLKIFPAVVILGARQCGKSTLLRMMSAELPSFLYLDLQNPDDFNKLSEPTMFFEANENATICLDEIQLVPYLFSVLRSVIDKNRRSGRFILLGSASRDLVQKTSESLAGRAGFIDLSPFTIDELQNDSYDLYRHWFRGGFPESYLSENDANAQVWLDNFIRTFVERDIPQLGFQTPAMQIRRFLQMCAHNQGQLLNLSKLGASLSVTHPTIRHYLDMTEQTYVMRSLPPFEQNLKKRLVKAPKTYIRDSGILHKLLQIPDFNGLMGHPVFGASWEGFVIENLMAQFPDFEFFHYRSSSGNEIDFLIKTPKKLIAVECKASTAPQLTKDNRSALSDIRPDAAFVASPIKERYNLHENVVAINLLDLINELRM